MRIYSVDLLHSFLGNVPPEVFAALDSPKEVGINMVPETVKNDLQNYKLS